MFSSSEGSQSQVIRIYCAQSKQLVHELPQIVSEVELLAEESRKDKAKSNFPFGQLCSMILERLSTSVEGSVFHVKDVCNAFQGKKNVQIYELLNVLKGLGYLMKVKKGTFKWFGPESEQVAKTFRDLKSIAFNHDGSVDSDDDDDESSTKRTIPRLTDKVMMIFLRAKPIQTISFHQIFVQVFKKEYQAGPGDSANLSKVVTALEVLGLIVNVVNRSEGTERKRSRADASYHYAGPAIDGYSSFEEIGKNEVDTEHEDLVEEIAPKKELETGEYFEEIGKIEADTDYEDLEEMDSIQEETAPKKELMLDEDGNWSVQDYIPVSYADNVVSGEVLYVCKEEDIKSDSDESSGSGKEDPIKVDVKDEILDD